MSGSDSLPGHEYAQCPDLATCEPHARQWMAEGARSAVQGTAERQSFAALVEAAVSAWRLQNDPASDVGEPMAPFVADALASYGYRRVSEDDETVERLARAMADADGWGDQDRVPLSQVYDFTRLARAALQALRGDQHG